MCFAEKAKDTHAGQQHEEEHSRHQVGLHYGAAQAPVLVQPYSDGYFGYLQRSTHDNDWNHSCGKDSSETYDAVPGCYNTETECYE